MTMINIFSKRSKQLKGDVLDVYQYDTLPQPFRVQVVHILNGMFGKFEGSCRATPGQEDLFNTIHHPLAKEYGVFELVQDSSHVHESVLKFILEAETEHVLDTIELSFRLAEGIGTDQLCRIRPRSQPREQLLYISVENALVELNHRFLEHGIGYQYDSGQIIAINSEFLHHEVTKPALNLLQDRCFAGAQTEFLNAHKRYRNQQYEDAISNSFKAFESTLKVICSQKGWRYSDKDGVNKLIDIVFRKGLIPQYLQSEFTSLISILKSGIPTIRNREGGHGRGSKPRHIPQYLAGYILHLTASTIVFLINAYKE